MIEHEMMETQSVNMGSLLGSTLIATCSCGQKVNVRDWEEHFGKEPETAITPQGFAVIDTDLRQHTPFDPRDYIAVIDEWLDENVSAIYKEEPLAQHWARVAKAGEEAGEAVDALIAWTGQNPRKPRREGAYDEMLDELADTALTGIYAMQHFTKDVDETMRLLWDRLVYHHGRLIVRND